MQLAFELFQKRRGVCDLWSEVATLLDTRVVDGSLNIACRGLTDRLSGFSGPPCRWWVYNIPSDRGTRASLPEIAVRASEYRVKLGNWRCSHWRRLGDASSPLLVRCSPRWTAGRIPFCWTGSGVLVQRGQLDLLLAASLRVVREVGNPVTRGWQHIYTIKGSDQSRVEEHEYHTQSISRALMTAAVVLSDLDLWYSNDCVAYVLVVCFFQQLRVLHLECDGFWKPELLDLLHLVPGASYRSLSALNRWVVHRLSLDAWHSAAFDPFSESLVVSGATDQIDVDGFFLVRRHVLSTWLSPHVLHTMLSCWSEPVDWVACPCLQVQSSLVIVCMQSLWRQEDNVRQSIQAQQKLGCMDRAARIMHSLHVYRKGCAAFHRMILRIQDPDTSRWSATVLAILSQWLSKTSLAPMVAAIGSEMRLHRSYFCSRMLVRDRLRQFMQDSLHHSVNQVFQTTVDAAVSDRLLMNAL